MADGERTNLMKLENDYYFVNDEVAKALLTLAEEPAAQREYARTVLNFNWATRASRSQVEENNQETACACIVEDESQNTSYWNEPSASQACASNFAASQDWSKPATLLMLSEYEESAKQFTSSSSLKPLLWQKLCKKLSMKGYNFTADSVSRKFRNMLQTYRRIHDSTKKTGEDGRKTKWPYYERFDAIYGKTTNATPITVLSCGLSKSSIKTSLAAKKRPLATPTFKTSKYNNSGVTNSAIKSTNINTSTLPKPSKQRNGSETVPPWFANFISERDQAEAKRFETLTDAVLRIAAAMEKKNDILERYLEVQKQSNNGVLF